jgi:hypothetical protein
MKPKNSKINADIFLIVAEMLFVAKQDKDKYYQDKIHALTIGEQQVVSYCYCCDNFQSLQAFSIDCEKEFDIFGEYFKPDGYHFGWWPLVNDELCGDHDYESRIYACLFLYELYK